MDNRLRWGRFTSSNNGDLMTRAKDKVSFGAPALSLISDKAMERKLGRSLDVENNARPLQWGKCVESVPFELLGTEYKMCSSETIVNPLYPFWSGTPDMIKYVNDEKVVCDIKCPITLKSFCTLVDAYERGGIQEVRKAHKEGDTYYWQLVSNAILTGCSKAELIVYMPYESELHLIKDEASKHGFQWITFSMDCELPFLIDGGFYKNINLLSFDIPQDDIDALTSSVIEANRLCGNDSQLPTIHDPQLPNTVLFDSPQ